MTIQRFLYKLFWKKFGVPVIICCGFVALATTFYHHSRLNVVESPPVTKLDMDHFHNIREKGLEDPALTRGVTRNPGYNTQQDKDTVLRYKSNEENHDHDYLKQKSKEQNQKEVSSKGQGQSHVNVKDTAQMQQPSDTGVSKENVDSNSEIDLDDTFFDELRKPHIHVEGNIVAVEDKSRSPHENNEIKDENNNPVIGLSGKKVDQSDTVHDEIDKTYYRNQLEKAMLEYHGPGSNIGKEKLRLDDIKSALDDERSDNVKPKEVRLNYLETLNDPQKKKDNKDNSINEVLHEHQKEESQGNINEEFNYENNQNNAFNEVAEPEYDSVVGIGKEDYIDSFLPPDMPSVAKITPMRNPGLYYSPLNPPVVFTQWHRNSYTACNAKFCGYGNEFAYLKNVIVDQSKFLGRPGGENIEEVLNQDEKKEYYAYEFGCFQLRCVDRPQYYFNNGHHVPDFMFNLRTRDVNPKDFNEEISDFTIAVTRYEYVNLYHTMTDWYNAFLLMNFFNQTQAKTSVLLVDAHPKGGLDSVWGVLFKSAKRLSDLKPKTKFGDMAWNILGYNSLILSHYKDELPLTEEYREFFLTSFRIDSKKTLHCDKLNILFIWRRNYVAHPRNPKGVISRKIRNERALLMAVKRNYKDHHVSGVQIDLFDMHQQLKLIAKADVLIGMHGAGLTHAMFLPKHAGLIELVPSYWGAMDHFLAIAKWRGLMYERWINMNPNIEIMDQSTRVPPPVVTSLLRSTLVKMNCAKPI